MRCIPYFLQKNKTRLTISWLRFGLNLLFLALSLMLSITEGFSKNPNIPPRPNPPKLVNDFAGMMTPTQQDNLEEELENFSRETSTQIVVVTINNLEGYDPAEFVLELGRLWGVGQKDKNNGVIIFASKEDHKINISPGQGLEGALPDIICGRIIRNEMAPAFKEGNYYSGFENAANAVIEATKGEYTASDANTKDDSGFPIGALFGLIVIIVVVISLLKSGGGKGGGGNYMSRNGGSFLTGAILGNLLGGMSGGRGGLGGGSFGGGGGGFGGFGGGSFGGGGASGSW